MSGKRVKCSIPPGTRVRTPLGENGEVIEQTCDGRVVVRYDQVPPWVPKTASLNGAGTAQSRLVILRPNLLERI